MTRRDRTWPRRAGPALVGLLVGLSLCAVGCGSVAGFRVVPASRAVDPGLVASEGAYMDELASEESVTMRHGLASATPAPVGDGSADSRPVADPGERLLIYSGAFTVAVPSVDEALEAARRMAEGYGGWVQVLRDETIVLRVPAARWEEALAGLRGLGRILSRSIEAQDVTEDVVDLRLRLENARALRKRLEELLAQAETVEVMLEVEVELNRIRTEIERLEGRLQLLANRVAFSTLTIRFVPADRAPARLQALPFPWLRELGIEGLLELPGGGR